MPIVLYHHRLLEKGKPPERVGRKASGLSRANSRKGAGRYGSGVAGQTPYLPEKVWSLPAKSL